MLPGAPRGCSKEFLGCSQELRPDGEVCRRLDALLAGDTLLLSLPGMEIQDEAVLRQVYARAGRPYPALHHAPLAILLAALHPTLSPAMAEVALQRERFLYSQLSCAWHHTRTDSLHCAEALVRRAAYSLRPSAAQWLGH